MATLSFKGKSFVQNYHLAVKYHELIPKKTKSLTKKVSLKDNLIIHGDNLKALKALLPTYAGKIKCIYIDPPYNTGNENWAYNDNVNSPMMQEWLGKVVDKEDLTKHDKWLCMMMPRLKLLRELLSQDGIIFVSIDENEGHRLHMLMDEIFSGNYVATFVWAGRGGKGGTTSEVEMNHEYVECYAKELSTVELKPVVTVQAEGNYRDAKGSYRRELLRQWGQGDRREDRPSMYFPITAPDGTIVYPVRTGGSEGRWRFGEASVIKMQENGDLDFVSDSIGQYTVYRKIREGKRSELATDSLLLDKGTASSGTIELKKIFGEKVFDNVKPTTLVKHLLELATYKDKGAIVLDSFAGSGTTAHAVLDLNKEDSGNRKFILVECEDYANEITAERVRRVIEGVPGAKDDTLRNGLGGSFSFFELGKPIEMESILEGKSLPSYLDLARYVFYTATGEEFLPEQVDEDRHFIGESKEYEVYLFYKPDLDYLKSTALTLEVAKTLGDYTSKKKLVFAPTKYLDLNDSELLAKHGLKDIEYCQLPFEIYKLKE
jgi:adenine-specific DNA-methyltransferase